MPGRPGGSCTRWEKAVDTACRCSPGCVALARAARRRRNQDKTTRVPAAPVRRAIQTYLRLAPDASLHRLSEASGVTPSTLYRLRCGTTETANPLTARRIAVAVHSTIGPVTDGCGALRRVEALRSQGWTLELIAEYGGCQAAALTPERLYPHAPRRVAQAVTRAFERLRYLSGPSDPDRHAAVGSGWLPWPCWGRGLDDPAYRPDLKHQDEDRVAAWQARTLRPLAS